MLTTAWQIGKEAMREQGKYRAINKMKAPKIKQIDKHIRKYWEQQSSDI